MKKYSAYKTVQLIILIVLAVFLLFYIFPNAGLYHMIANDSSVKVLAVSVWALLLISFVFVLLDYTFFFGYRKEYSEMELAAGSDPVSGIANRFSCDVLIEKYTDKPLPENIGAVMIDLSNIQEINRLYGHVQGNAAIRDFSNILRISSSDLCFVGRNGGNKFLAVFEQGDPDRIQTFIDRVDHRVNAHNRDLNIVPIEFTYGTAFSGTDDVDNITALISLANSRIRS